MNTRWLLTGEGEAFDSEAAETRAEYQNLGKNSGNMVGNITGGKNKFTTLADCAKENEHLRAQVIQLTSQLADKQEIIQLLKSQKPNP